jgi:PadR family transcriptional regulator, regulatory protein PadR
MTFQLGSTMLDMCVLSILTRGATYGYSMTNNLKQVINVSDSTLYPVLRRLQKNEFLETYDEPFEGRNRRYYKITDSGMVQLNFYKLEWIEYKLNISKILDGGNEDE